MRKLITNPGFVGFALVYIASVGILAAAYGYGPAEPLAIFVIFGLLLPGAVLATTGGDAKLPEVPVRDPAGEVRDILLYTVVVVGFLVFGLDGLHALVRREPLLSLSILAAKLAVFVVGPALLFRRRGYGWRELFPIRLARRDLSTIVIVGGLFVLVNAVVGKGPERIAASGYSAGLLVEGMLFTYLYLLVEVGLVEEFFFRRLMQSRLSAWTGSEISGLFVAAVLFGLAHAPGFYLRWESTAADLFTEPTVLFAACYSIAVISVAGLMMGVLWLRTRNLALLIAIHAAGDLLPTTVDEIRAFWG